MRTTLLLIAFLGIVALDQAQAQSRKRSSPCRKCENTGKVPNPFLTEELAALEKEVLYCSYCIKQDKKGHGLAWLPCTRCRNVEAQKEAELAFDALVAERIRWMKERREVDDFLQSRSELIHLETEHFIIAWSIPKFKTEDKKLYKAHVGAHLYARRLEAFYADFKEFLMIEEEEMRNHKHFIYLFEDQKTSLKAAQKYTGLKCLYAARQTGNPSVLVTWWDKTMMPDDSDFHRHLVHHTSHLFNVAFYLMEWMAKDAGWADEGLGHFFEIRHFHFATNTCDEEGDDEVLSKEDWQVDVRKAVEGGTAASFAELCGKSTTSLFHEEHKFAWSFVDFLLDRNRAKFKEFMRAIKEKKPSRDALKESYGLNPMSFQELWEKYVLEKYRKEPLKFGPAQTKRQRMR